MHQATTGHARCSACTAAALAASYQALVHVCTFCFLVGGTCVFEGTPVPGRLPVLSADKLGRPPPCSCARRASMVAFCSSTSRNSSSKTCRVWPLFAMAGFATADAKFWSRQIHQLCGEHKLRCPKSNWCYPLELARCRTEVNAVGCL